MSTVRLYKKAPKVPTLFEFNKILDSLSHEDKIGHLFINDIKFLDKNEKRCCLIKFTPLFLKKKKLSWISICQFFSSSQ